MPTSGLSGDKYLTIQFWETFDKDSFLDPHDHRFRYWHTPRLQLVDVSTFVNDGISVVLAKVSFGTGSNTGKVSALTQDLRQGTSLPVSSIHVQKQVSSTAAGSARVEMAEAGALQARASGGLDLTAPNASDEIHLARNDGGNLAKVSLGADQIVARGSLSVEGNIGANGNIHGVSGSGGIGVLGESTNGTGVLGQSQSDLGVIGIDIGVRGISVTGPGMQGESVTYSGVRGISELGLGVEGESTSGTGVQGKSQSNTGVRGDCVDGTGVRGESHSSLGVWGSSQSGSGMLGESHSSLGVWGRSTTGDGVLGEGQSGSGVRGTSQSGTGVQGESTTNTGVRGSSVGGLGVEGESTSGTGVRGASTSGIGVEGGSQRGIGVRGNSDIGIGMQGESLTNSGVRGTSELGLGVEGESVNRAGVQGSSTIGMGISGISSTGIGVFAQSTDGNDAIVGTSPNGDQQAAGVRGISAGNNSNGVIGEANNGPLAYAVWGQSNSGFAGVFSGNVKIENGNLNLSGTLTQGMGGFRIDHPLDPENKYLSHSFVESPDMLNIYNGNLTTNSNGDATALLPDYFEALNQDFCYQLTVIGQFAQAIVSGEVSNNRFTIKTDKPNVKVSWQITGIRKDLFANAHRLVVEEDKQAGERGTYLHAEAHGKPETQSVGYARGKQFKGPEKYS